MSPICARREEIILSLPPPDKLEGKEPFNTHTHTHTHNESIYNMLLIVPCMMAKQNFFADMRNVLQKEESMTAKAGSSFQ